MAAPSEEPLFENIDVDMGALLGAAMSRLTVGVEAVECAKRGDVVLVIV